MTHERTANVEAEGGPENDGRLPDAWDQPLYDDPAEALAASPTRVFPEHDDEALTDARIQAERYRATHG